MTSTAKRRRWGILDAYKQTLNEAFNPRTGTTAKLIRKVAITCSSKLAVAPPEIHVWDAGQRSAGGSADQALDGNEYILSVLVRVIINTEWPKESAVQPWIEFFDDLMDLMNNNLMEGLATGIISTRYVRDDPVELKLQDGTSVAAWDFEFETQYVSA